MNYPHAANPAGIVRYDALAIAGVAGVQRVSVEAGSLLGRRVDGGFEVLAVGGGAEVDAHPAAAGTERVALTGSVLIPPLVNAHTHLDLTHLGPRAGDPEAGFMVFVDVVRSGRATQPEAIAASVAEGVDLCLAGGSAAVGDIAGATGGAPNSEAYRQLAKGPLLGVSYLEFFGIGRGAERGVAAAARVLDQEPAGLGRVRLGLQPHAPYSVSRASYRWAIDEARRRGLPLCTHLAETPEEHACVSRGSGPFREFLERLGAWDEGTAAEFGGGAGSIEHLADLLAGAPFLAVHINQASDREIETLARTGTSVAYCPRASEYFGGARHFGPHRYRDMMAAGINVCLGTDSIINLPARAASRTGGGISVLDEMRLLFRRDGTAAATLLAMGTTSGARALGINPGLFEFSPGVIAGGVLAIDVGCEPGGGPGLDRALRAETPARWLEGPGAGGRYPGSSAEIR